MSLRSGLRIAKKMATAGEKLRVLEENGSNIGKRMAIMEREMEAKMNLEENLDVKAPVVEEKAIKENSMIVEEFIKEDNSEAKESNQPDERGKGNLVVDPIVNASDVLVVEDHILIDIDEIKYGTGEGSVNPRKRRKAKVMGTSESRKEADRNKARELAPKFAFFKAEEEEEEEEAADDLGQNVDKEEDWPGPFSTAMNIVRNREKMLIARELNSSSKKDKDIGNKIQWAPSNARKRKPSGRSAPPLHDLCIKVLCENADEIESLNGVPDVLKHRIVWMLCRTRKMSSHIFNLLVSGLPTEIRLNDCSWATEGDFEGAFAGCNTERLKVVQLDLSGRCLPDYLLQATLAKSPNSLPLLTTISLKGNYRLSDGGLNAIVASAPLLSSINLSQCSLITSVGIIGLADKLGSVLRELYIDDCQDVDAMLVLPSLLKLKYLEVLSAAAMETVTNKFVKKLVSVCGSTMKELVFHNCRKLTAVSMKAIGEHCSQLCSLDLRNLNRLNDSAIGHLANGCRSIQILKLRSNAVSDEAVAAFMEASGSSLLEFSINNIGMVAEHTAVAISRRCSSTLKSLDLSFCRKITDEALGLIVDSCSNLQMLKLFGCTQITNVFLEGHSNSTVKIIGSKGSVLDQIEVPNFL